MILFLDFNDEPKLFKPNQLLTVEGSSKYVPFSDQFLIDLDDSSTIQCKNFKIYDFDLELTYIDELKDVAYTSIIYRDLVATVWDTEYDSRGAQFYTFLQSELIFNLDSVCKALNSYVKDSK